MNRCAGIDCEREATTRGLCRKHYYRLYRTGDPECVRTPPGLPPNTTGCRITGCIKPHGGLGLCRNHLRRLHVYGDPLGIATARKGRLPRSLAERFWEKVAIGPPDQCWPWLGKPTPDGYGRFKVDGKNVSAHVLAWELTNGPMPPGMRGLHRCDNPPCCNPADVFPGTQGDNVRDMVRKGRAADVRGARNPSARLDEAQVRAIRAARDMTNRALAERYAVSPVLIGLILKRKVWAHI